MFNQLMFFINMAKDLSGQQVGMSPVNDVNSPRPNIPRGYNQFPQSYMHLTTERYGEYNPFYWAKCERGDIQNLNSEHSLHTFTLQSPMVGKLKKTKSYIKVPMQAIYPRNWEKMFTIPTQGDDVPENTRALFDVRSLINQLISFITTQEFFSDNFLKGIVLLELICSHDSLFEKFNMHLDYKFTIAGSEDIMSIDKVLDFVYAEIIDLARTLPVSDSNDVYYYVTPSDGVLDSQRKYISPRRFLEMMRRSEFVLTDGWTETAVPQAFSDFDLVSGYDSRNQSGIGSDYEYFLNIEPIISYQLACAQFATNDFVDFVYSAKLYRDNMQSLVFPAVIDLDGSWPSFDYNGISCLYDVFSEYILNSVIDYIGNNTITSFDFFINLFSYVPSLRYGDYFTGGKPQPLAVGEYTAAVNNNEVSAIDITRSIQMQRLLHRVNMVGRKLGDYLSGIFGGKLPEAEKDVPIFLAHQNFDVEGFETNNTGSDQLDPDVPNTITSHLRSTKDKFAFEITIDEPCYIIGMSSYAMMRVYSKTLDRFAMHHDRYDDFIPEMQYIGDQQIYSTELDSNADKNFPFGYALRYMEYKQRYSYASGGFIENLPSWAFITDNKDGNPASTKITPDYIRSSPSEFDRFYKSLTGYSLGSYFHFIVAYTNHTAPLRRMEYTPEILK